MNTNNVDIEEQFQELIRSNPNVPEARELEGIFRLAFMGGVATAGMVIFSKETVDEGLVELRRQLQLHCADLAAIHNGRN